MSDKQSWTDRLFGGFRKTSEKLTSNLTEVVGTARLDDATLDDVEDALILSDLGPSAAARIREEKRGFGRWHIFAFWAANAAFIAVIFLWVQPLQVSGGAG